MLKRPALPSDLPATSEAGMRAEQLSLLGSDVTKPELAVAVQLSLLGQPVPVRLPAELWRSWLATPGVVKRFEAKRYVRRAGQCWPWLGAVSDTGHGIPRGESARPIAAWNRSGSPACLPARVRRHTATGLVGGRGSSGLPLL
jgi:hypothetical protein